MVLYVFTGVENYFPELFQWMLFMSWSWAIRLKEKFFDVQIVEGNALPTLILMLRSEDVGIHYEAVRTNFINLDVAFALLLTLELLNLLSYYFNAATA
jgi:hypothetical protein